MDWKMSAKISKAAVRLLWALALRQQAFKTSHFLTLHISGILNEPSDTQSILYVCRNNWHLKSDKKYLKLFNSYLPLPNQKISQLFRLTSSIAMRSTHDLLKQSSRMDAWWMIPNLGKLFGGTSVDIPGLLKFTCSYKSKNYHGTGCISSSRYSQRKLGLEIAVLKRMSNFWQCENWSRPLTRPHTWI